MTQAVPHSVPMTTIPVTGEDVGTLLRMWRAGADLTIEQVATAASERLPAANAVGRETVRRYERGRFPAAGPDALTVAAIAIACGRRLGELPEEMLTDVNLMAEMLRNLCFPISSLVAA